MREERSGGRWCGSVRASGIGQAGCALMQWVRVGGLTFARSGRRSRPLYSADSCRRQASHLYRWEALQVRLRTQQIYLTVPASGVQCQQGRHGVRVQKTDLPRGKSEAAGRMCSAVVQRGGRLQGRAHGPVHVRAFASGPGVRVRAGVTRRSQAPVASSRPMRSRLRHHEAIDRLVPS